MKIATIQDLSGLSPQGFLYLLQNRKDSTSGSITKLQSLTLLIYVARTLSAWLVVYISDHDKSQLAPGILSMRRLIDEMQRRQRKELFLFKNSIAANFEQINNNNQDKAATVIDLGNDDNQSTAMDLDDDDHASTNNKPSGVPPPSKKQRVDQDQVMNDDIIMLPPIDKSAEGNNGEPYDFDVSMLEGKLSEPVNIPEISDMHPDIDSLWNHELIGSHPEWKDLLRLPMINGVTYPSTYYVAMLPEKHRLLLRSEFKKFTEKSPDLKISLVLLRLSILFSSFDNHLTILFGENRQNQSWDGSNHGSLGSDGVMRHCGQLYSLWNQVLRTRRVIYCQTPLILPPRSEKGRSKGRSKGCMEDQHFRLLRP